jgi:hypothetical protein
MSEFSLYQRPRWVRVLHLPRIWYWHYKGIRRGVGVRESARIAWSLALNLLAL